MEFETVIGLEIHCQLNTNTKIFAAESNSFGGEANTQTSVLTLAHPGVLPKLNKEIVTSAIKLGLAFDCEINRLNFFDRKNYFYPDLPKGYQVSQDKMPICLGGRVVFKIKNGKSFTNHEVKIHHIHMEEDAGKSIHDLSPDYTYLDYNRAGTPLLEIVSEPCIKSPAEAAGYLSQVRNMVRFLGIGDGNMEEGSIRADLNISLRPVGSEVLGTKVEIKNMNSIRFLQKAAEYEIERQTAVLLQGGTLVQETRSFDPETGKTASMRVKETMNDYRYFPEPDLAPNFISEEKLAEIKAEMPMLPLAIFEELVSKYGLNEEQAYLISETSELSNYFYETAKFTKAYRSIANWILSNIKGYLNENNLELKDFVLQAQQLAEIINLIEDNKISNTAAQKLMILLTLGTGLNVLAIAESNGLIQNTDASFLDAFVLEVLNENAAKVEEYKKGKKGLLGMFVGEVMKKSKGSADPKLLNALILEKLNSK
jgi:aspartyl-tRNA(Asn)/glutamyl-tRNA(Gln) amidotransferase subunit B